MAGIYEGGRVDADRGDCRTLEEVRARLEGHSSVFEGYGRQMVDDFSLTHTKKKLCHTI